MAQGNPLPGEKYLHFKNRLYQVLAVAYHSETMERFVVYQALYGDFKVYIRPYNMFVSEVDHEKYPEVTQRYRFQYAGNLAQESKEKEAQEKSEKSVNCLEEETATGRIPAAEKNPSPASTHVPAERSADTREQEEIPEGMNPWLARFLDADDFHEKYKVVCDMHSNVTDRLIDDIAVVMDVVIPEGKLSERYAQLKYCIRTRQKYESTRLR